MGQENHVKTALRLPAELHGKLHAAADEAGRSYNSELIARLQGSFEQSGEAEALRTELAITQQQLRTFDRYTALLDSAQDMLARFVVTMFERLPEKERADEAMALPHRLAEAMVAASRTKGNAAWKKLFASKHPTIAANIGDFREHLGAAGTSDTMAPDLTLPDWLSKAEASDAQPAMPPRQIEVEIRGVPHILTRTAKGYQATPKRAAPRARGVYDKRKKP